MKGNQAINMDRGGFGQCLDGTNCAAIFDGVSAGGKINLFAAQAFADFVTERVARCAGQFQQGASVNDILARQMFEEAVASSNNPGRRHEALNAEGGAATGMFVCIQECKGKEYCIVNGAGIGDCTTFAICCGGTEAGDEPPPEEARQLSVTGFRRGRSAKDSGGQLTMSMGVDGTIWTFSQPVDHNDIVLLCTDGLTDNVYMPEACTIIPLVASSSYFDAIPVHRYPASVGPGARLPRFADLEELTKQWPRTPADTLTPEKTVARLRSYVKWITLDEFDLEQRYYSAQMKIMELQFELTSMPSPTCSVSSSSSSSSRRPAISSPFPPSHSSTRSSPLHPFSPQPLSSSTRFDIATPPPVFTLDVEDGGGDAGGTVADGRPAAADSREMANAKIHRQIAEHEADMARLLRTREAGLATKTDDAMLIAMRPFHNKPVVVRL